LYRQEDLTMQTITLLDILAHTPPWVWIVLCLLLAIGLRFTRTRRIPVRRALVMPLAITALSLHGTFSVFHGSPVAIVVWSGAAALSAAWFATSALPRGVYYDAAQRVVVQPGSWTPLAVMMLFFAIRYTAAASLAIHPQWAQEEGVAALAASIYGALSGVFLGRTLRTLRLTRRPATQPSEQHPGSDVAWG
jgi:hypothetical protein